MAMKLKKKVEAVEENVEEAVVETAVEEAEVVEAENEEGVQESVEYPEQLNEDEKEALEATAPEDETGEVSTVKMENILNLVTDEFNLSGKKYTVSQYKDGGSKVTLSMVNPDYDVTITVKDAYSKIHC